MESFKSTLPPRKRARTQEEKEQRRVERIMRNRRAAHQSREKKRKYVETLENYIEKLVGNLKKYEQNQALLSSHIKDQDVLSQLQVIDDLKDLSDIKIDNKKSKSDKDSQKEVETGEEDEEEDTEVEVKNEEAKTVKQEPVDYTYETSDINGLSAHDSDGSYTQSTDSNSYDLPIESDFFFNSKPVTLDEPITPIKDMNYNYLSPVSINSPSPMNLSLDFDLYNSTVHNSEVVVT